MHGILKLLFLLLLGLYMAKPAFAVEVEVQFEKVWWQYQEYAKDASVSSVQADFLPSKSLGDNALMTLGLNSLRERWFFSLSGSVMFPTSARLERWSIKQTNDLKVRQADVRLDAQRQVMENAWLGVWLAERQQKQMRENFVVDGLPVVVAGEPVLETITSSWLGVSFVGLGGPQQQLQATLDVAVPLRVKVANALLTSDFSRRFGYQSGVNFRWQLPESSVGFGGLNMTLSYAYQELGGEQTGPGDFWPYNRWQTIGFGLLYAW